MAVHYKTTLLGWSLAPEALLSPQEEAGQGIPLSSEGCVLDFVPPALRRRCSTFSKVTLAVAHAALRNARSEELIPTVFASMHGESEITRGLLSDLAGNQQLSPMGFSLSVHNASSGLYSIATGNTAPSTAIAAGEDTFFMGLCETLMMLHEGGFRRVLYVCSDDLVPAQFLQEGAFQPVPYAVAVLLGMPGSGAGVELTIESSMEAEPAEADAVPHGVRFAQWLHAGTGDLDVRSRRTRWVFRSEAGHAQEGFASSYR